MSVRDSALKNILKRKLLAEDNADKNLNAVLQDEDIRILFVDCKRLVVDIAKLEVSGRDATNEKNKYNENREMIASLLKSKSISKETLRPQYHCSKCKDTGIIKGMDCECLKKEMSEELIKLSGLDKSKLPHFEDDFTMFDNPKQVETIYSKMKKLIDELDKVQYNTVLIMGDTGVGKTHLLGCMTSYALDKKYLIKYSTAFNLVQDMLKYHCAKVEEKEDIISPYINSEILFIDDLGTENKINNVTNEYLYLIINERMQNNKKTIITTNLDFAQIQEVYGERIFSRLMHKKESLKINFTGSDLRLKK